MIPFVVVLASAPPAIATQSTYALVARWLSLDIVAVPSYFRGTLALRSVVPSRRSSIFLIIAKSVISTVAHFRCVFVVPDVNAPCRDTWYISVSAVLVRVHFMYSLFALFLSRVKKYVQVGSATPSSSVAESRVAEVAQIAVFRLRVVLKSAAIFQSVAVMLLLY